MTVLSVNINKIALIRNGRGADYPNLLQTALDCEKFGAQGITVHPRPDERHVKYSDIPILKSGITTELNVEGYPDERFLSMVIQNRPAQCTLVPDAPDALTSDGGWDTITHQNYLTEIIARLHEAKIRVSLFVNADTAMVEGAKKVNADRIELYTGAYAHDFYTNKTTAVLPHIAAATHAIEYGLGVNAGHDLNLDNLAYYKKSLPALDEVSIGHAIVCDALYYGLQNTIQLYLKELQQVYK